MTLKERITEDMKAAMRAKESELRMTICGLIIWRIFASEMI